MYGLRAERAEEGEEIKNKNGYQKEGLKTGIFWGFRERETEVS